MVKVVINYVYSLRDQKLVEYVLGLYDFNLLGGWCEQEQVRHYSAYLSANGLKLLCRNNDRYISARYDVSTVKKKIGNNRRLAEGAQRGYTIVEHK